MNPSDKRHQKGNAAIEMAVFLPVFSFVLIGLIDFGAVTRDALQLSSAVLAGEQFAVNQPSNTSGITSAVQHATSLPAQKIAATATTFCECSGIAVSCQSQCRGTLATYVTVSASYNVPTIINYPGRPNPYPLNKSVSVRVQ